MFENFASNVTISGFTITDGYPFDNNGGGGILNHGGLSLNDSIVSNSATPYGNQPGGGVFNDAEATLTVIGSTINGNHAGCDGGGIFSSGGTLTMMNSTISGNSVGGGDGCLNGGTGGGIFSSGGSSTVTNSTISGNDAGGMVGEGGGILLAGAGTLTVTTAPSATTSRNYGGGIRNVAQTNLTVKESTLSGNSASVPRRHYTQRWRDDDRGYCPECRRVRRNDFQQWRHGHLPWV